MNFHAVNFLHRARVHLELVADAGVSDHTVELCKQAIAIIEAAVENEQPKPLPPEFNGNLASAIESLERCQQLCSGKLQNAVFDITAKLEVIRSGDL